MAAIVRKGDACTGHGAFPPRKSISGAATVFFNGKPVVRKGDKWDVHCDPSPSCHAGSTKSGSPTVFAEGQPIMRVGDPVDCGSQAAAGSPDCQSG